MNNDQFFDMAQALVLKCIDVMATKGQEYIEGSDNKLANFEAEALETGVPAPEIIHIFANKHQRAINNYRKNRAVESEPLEMRFVDRINYLILELAQYIALGYEPREEWLIEALGMAVEELPSDILPFTPATEQSEDSSPTEEAPALPPTVADEDAEGEPCCGVPGHAQCCQAAAAPTPQAEQPRRRRRPTREKRRPRSSLPLHSQGFEADDEGVPIAKPDRRHDPDVLRERGRARADE